MKDTNGSDEWFTVKFSFSSGDQWVSRHFKVSFHTPIIATQLYQTSLKTIYMLIDARSKVKELL